MFTNILWGVVIVLTIVLLLLVFTSGGKRALFKELVPSRKTVDGSLNRGASDEER